MGVIRKDKREVIRALWDKSKSEKIPVSDLVSWYCSDSLFGCHTVMELAKPMYQRPENMGDTFQLVFGFCKKECEGKKYSDQAKSFVKWMMKAVEDLEPLGLSHASGILRAEDALSKYFQFPKQDSQPAKSAEKQCVNLFMECDWYYRRWETYKCIPETYDVLIETAKQIDWRNLNNPESRNQLLSEIKELVYEFYFNQSSSAG